MLIFSLLFKPKKSLSVIFRLLTRLLAQIFSIFGKNLCIFGVRVLFSDHSERKKHSLKDLRKREAEKELMETIISP